MAARLSRCAALAALLAAGCSEPEAVRVLQEPPPAAPTAPDVPADQKKFRTLAAMVPSDSPEGGWWFFKLSGPAAVVAKYEADFDRLFRSLRATADADDPITWGLPPGWTREPGDKMKMRFATLKAPGGDAEVAVSRAGGYLLGNAQRWWGQLWGKDKEQDVTPANLPAYVSRREVNGRLVLRADMTGPNDPNASRPMATNPHGGQ